MDGIFHDGIGTIGYGLLVSSWVNIVMIASTLGMGLLGKRSEGTLLGGTLLLILVLLFIQGEDLVFAGGLLSSMVGLCAAGMFFSLMLERKDSPFYNTVRAVALVLVVPVSLLNLLVIGFWAFFGLAELLF